MAAIDLPLAIVAGELDRVDPPAVVKEHVVARCPGARVHILPNREHLLPVEAPEDVSTIVASFAARL